MEKLTSEISKQFKESRELEEKIRETLGGIGYEI